jgi:methylated-DNA-[protein]-cysteine S-methyltransferase
MTLSARLLDSIASAAVREGLADAIYTRLDTPIGRLLVVQGERGVVRVGFPGEPVDALLAQVAERLGPRIVASDRELAATRDALSAYFEGAGEPLDLPVDLSLVRSHFRRSALALLRDEVGPGQVVTYGALAAKVGRPKAARAVGSACATNPVPIIVPCHRVLPGGGGVGSYGGGPEVKRLLLAHEGAPLAGRRAARARRVSSPRP